ncbi:MAG TPA: glycosyltransferase family 2 protein [Thermomicrobiales bacterium]|nr:glycosyltransferase family 2 protein [Thermomicrobiales bacterium]
MTRVDVIIPTHNGGDLLKACLRSLARSEFTDFSLIVFDDASLPAVADLVHEVWSPATVIRSESNVGLAVGCNTAIATGASEYVALLNDDTEVEAGWIGALVDCADRNPDAGSVASKIKLMSDRGKLHSTGDFFSARGLPGNRGAWMDDVGQFDREEPVFSACGGAALYRRAALDEIRLPDNQIFDERLFMYCEDVDLGWRLQIGRWPCVYAPAAVVYHHVSATGGGPLASYHVARNVLHVLSMSIPPGVLAPFRARIIACQAGRVARMARHMREPAARAALRGVVAGMALAFRATRSRRAAGHVDVIRLRSLLTDNAPRYRGM